MPIDSPPSTTPAALAAAAPRGLRRMWLGMCLAALAVALLAIGIDVAGRLGIFGAAEVAERSGFIPRTLAAFAMALCAVAVVWSLLQRSHRELARRRWAVVTLSAGVGILFTGQVVGYLITAGDPGVFQGWVEAAPLLMAEIVVATAVIALSWPPGMTRRDRLAVLRNGVMAALGLAIIWLAVVVPTERPQDMVAGHLVEVLDPWAQYLGFVALAVVASASRRSGALPIRQLVLLQGSILIYMVSDIAGHAIPGADRESQLTYSIAGYCVASYVMVLFSVRPALETDSAESGRRRDLWSILIPFAPIPLAGVAWAWSRLVYGPLDPQLAVFAIVTVLAAATIMLMDRIQLASDLRRASQHHLASTLRTETDSEWFRALIGDSGDLVTVVDRDGRIVYQSPVLLPMLGYGSDALVGRYFAELTEGYQRHEVAQLLLRASHDASDRGPYEMNLMGRDGQRRATETVITPLRADGSDGFVLTSRDVTDRRRLRAEMADSSLRDPLTQLPNRDAFLARLRAEVPAARPGELAVALFDLHAFRSLNDSRGHEAGDHVLRMVSEALVRLPAAVRAVARTGADEFGLVVVADPVEFALGEIERELDDALEAVLLSDGRVVRIEFDLGYAVLESGRGSSAEMMEQADLALAEARTLPAGGMVRFDPTMRTALVERLRAEADLRESLAEGRLQVHYQPIVHLAGGAMCGVEALARLTAKDGSAVAPAEFIPLAEELGLIKRIGELVMQQALADARLVGEVLGREVAVAVNISAEQLDDSLVPMVAEALADSELPPHLLVLELTETALAANRESAAQLLHRLRSIGCRVALDDFGTGYSSMAYLADLPVDRLKIDTSFIGSMGSSRKSLVLVRTLLQLAHSLGLIAVAEGVETIEQADLLRGMDCERAQGYLFARPMALSDLLLMLQVTGGLLPLEAK